MLERLDVWLAILTLGALAYYELRLGRFIGPLLGLAAEVAERGKAEVEERRRRRAVRLRRDDLGRFAGSDSSVPDRPDERSEPDLRSDRGTALESGGTGVPPVPSGTISQVDIALIALRLGKGMSPSDVAKSLPGFSGRKYNEYKNRVELVRAMLAEDSVEEAVEQA